MKEIDLELFEIVKKKMGLKQTSLFKKDQHEKVLRYLLLRVLNNQGKSKVIPLIENYTVVIV